MPTLSFDGETHNELVVKVRRWLASVDGTEAANVSAAQAVSQGAEVTKEALRIIASVAPEPIAQSEVVKGLTSMGYKVTDTTRGGGNHGTGHDRGSHRWRSRPAGEQGGRQGHVPDELGDGSPVAPLHPRLKLSG